MDRGIYRLTSLVIVLFLLTCIGCSNKNADWANGFVIWDDQNYRDTGEIVPFDHIGSELGSIKKYSDREKTYSNGFSNVFQKGSKLYQIVGEDEGHSIAVQVIENDQETYYKLINTGKYANK